MLLLFTLFPWLRYERYHPKWVIISVYNNKYDCIVTAIECHCRVNRFRGLPVNSRFECFTISRRAKKLETTLSHSTRLFVLLFLSGSSPCNWETLSFRFPCRQCQLYARPWGCWELFLYRSIFIWAEALDEPILVIGFQDVSFKLSLSHGSNLEMRLSNSLALCIYHEEDSCACVCVCLRAWDALKWNGHSYALGMHKSRMHFAIPLNMFTRSNLIQGSVMFCSFFSN